jgi:hypothetical protein
MAHGTGSGGYARDGGYDGHFFVADDGPQCRSEDDGEATRKR